MPLHMLVMIALVAAFGALAGTTQWMAAHFGYDPRLGRPLVSAPAELRAWFGWGVILVGAVSLRMSRERRARRRVPVVLACGALLAVLWHGPLYHPARLFEWWPQLRARADSAPLLSRARLIGVVFAFGMATGTFVVVRPRRIRMASDSHGTASWGTGDEFRATSEETERLRHGGGLGEKLLLGRHDDGSLMVLAETSGHLLTVATTRSGKGIGTVMPNALGYGGSMLITDPKGESFFVTAEHRKKRLGQTIHVLDPFEVTRLEGTSNHDMMAYFNPLRVISTVGPEARLALVRARVLTETLILESKGDNAFWDRMARQVGCGFLLYVAFQFDHGCSQEDAFPVITPYGRDLLTLRYLTSLGSEDFNAVLEHMGGSPHPEVRRVANMLQGADERTRQNIMSSVHAQLAFLDAPQMASVLAEFVPDQLGRNPQPNPLPHADLSRIKDKGVRQTTYLVIPPAFLEAYAAWLRLMIVAVNDIITRTIEPPDLPIVMMLDELGNLGRIEAIRRGVSLVAAYGVRYWLIVHDLTQMEDAYDKAAWETMFANVAVKQLFGTGDLRTAEALSELTGETTVYSDSGSDGKSLDSAGWIGKGRSVSDSATEKGRKLLLKDEVLRMPADKQLLIIRGHEPLFVDKLNYTKMPEVRGLFNRNPMVWNRRERPRQALWLILSRYFSRWTGELIGRWRAMAARAKQSE